MAPHELGSSVHCAISRVKLLIRRSQLTPLDQERLAFGAEMLTLSFFAVLFGGATCFIFSLIAEIKLARRTSRLLDKHTKLIIQRALAHVSEHESPWHRRGGVTRSAFQGASKHSTDVKMLIMGKVR